MKFSCELAEKLQTLDESCEGLFLILDTDRHLGQAPDRDEVIRHVTGCGDCQDLGNHLD